jgi:hypothetical protein
MPGGCTLEGGLVRAHALCMHAILRRSSMAGAVAVNETFQDKFCLTVDWAFWVEPVH